MKSCEAGCPRELVSQDCVSVGVVDGFERIARGAYDPRHGNARTLNIKSQLIPSGDIVDGTGSVYRLAPPGISIAELIDLLTAREDGLLLFAITAATAEEIRGIRFAEDFRAFCVVDECDCDAEGGKHPAHAHISLCRCLASNGVAKEDENYQQAYRELMLLLRRKNAHVWNKIPDKAAAKNV